MMRQILAMGALVLCLSWTSLVQGGTLEFDFANTSGANLSFSGQNGVFSFTPDSNGNDFQITNDSGGTGSALNLFGTISGTFTIGTISGSSAPVTGSGVLTISDGTNNYTADISLVSISKPGSQGTLNPTEVVNLSNVHYAGGNSDLSAFAAGGSPTAMLGFFNGHTLAQLQSGGSQVNTPFLGSLTAIVPEPSTMALALAAGPALGGFWFSRRRRKATV
jgi:hypothetical protein